MANESKENGPSIDPEILDKLGLAEQDVKNFDAERKHEERVLQALEKEGKQRAVFLVTSKISSRSKKSKT